MAAQRVVELARREAPAPADFVTLLTENAPEQLPLAASLHPDRVTAASPRKAYAPVPMSGPPRLHWQYASDFNQPLDSWDVASVTSMQDMFYVRGGAAPNPPSHAPSAATHACTLPSAATPPAFAA